VQVAASGLSQEKVLLPTLTEVLVEGLARLLSSAQNTRISGSAGGKTGYHFHNTETFVPVFPLLAYFSISQNCRTPMQPVIPTPRIISQLLQMLLPSHVAHPSEPVKELSTFSSSKAIKPNFWRLLNTNSGSIQLYGRRHVGSAKFKQASSPVREEGKCWGSIEDKLRNTVTLSHR